MMAARRASFWCLLPLIVVAPRWIEIGLKLHCNLCGGLQCNPFVVFIGPLLSMGFQVGSGSETVKKSQKNKRFDRDVPV
jgi:hypothetical protein